MESSRGSQRVNKLYPINQKIHNWHSKEHKLSAKMFKHTGACSIMEDLVKARISASHNYVKVVHVMASTRAKRANLMKIVVQCFSAKKVTHGRGLPSAKI